MRNFVFYNPTKILFGEGKIADLGKEIVNHGAKKVLLHYGKSSIFKNGVYDQVTKTLKEAGIEYVEFGGVKANPVLSMVYEGIELCRNENVDAILAVGGGSVIDSAKAIAAGVKYDGDVWDAFEGKVRLKDGLPIFTVLTLSATGSEMNGGSVITKEDEKKKWAFSAGAASYPRVTVIDPANQYTLPPNQTVNGAVDAMSHVFELYFDGTDNTDVQDELAEGIIRTMMKHVKVLLRDPQNYESRAQFAWGATIALNGWNTAGRNGGDWATHMIEHSLSAFYDVAHGAGLAVIFPAWMKYVHNEKPEKFVRLAENVFGVKGGTDEEKITAMIERLQHFYQEIGAPITLTDLNVPESDLEKLADNAALAAPLGKLKKLNREDILNIYKLAYN